MKLGEKKDIKRHMRIDFNLHMNAADSHFNYLISVSDHIHSVMSVSIHECVEAGGMVLPKDLIWIFL